jgi:hypothetical protein
MAAFTLARESKSFQRDLREEIGSANGRLGMSANGRLGMGGLPWNGGCRAQVFDGIYLARAPKGDT